ncbi:MAG: PEGA domain-containing protein, partial [Nitrospinota bacterium]|nr:PEGA domain-containing protein [Nitrospinota bacterium]
MVFRAIVVTLALAMAALLASTASAQQQPTILETGVKAYQIGELVEAYKILKRALAEAQTEVDQATAHLYLAMVYMAWDQRELAAGSITQAAQLDPGRQLASADFPPDVIEIFENAKPIGKGIIIVRASPEGAQVSLDGRPSGMADGSSIEVPPGRYQVSISKDGYWTQTRVVEVMERASEALEVELVQVVAPLVIRHSPAPYIHERRSLQVSATVTGGTPPFTVTLYIRASGKEEYLASSLPHKADSEYAAAATANAQAGGFVEYFIIAKDSAGSISRSSDPYDPYKIPVLPRDNQPPGVSHTPPTKASAMEPLTLKFVISDQSAMESVKLFYKRGDDIDYTLRLLSSLDDRGLYSVTIPGQLMEAEEIFYYLVATDTAGNFRSLGSAPAPFVVKPIHEPVSKETKVQKRETIDGRVSNKVTIGAGIHKGYKKGDTLFAINVVTRPTGQDLPPKIIQELAGEIVLTNVERFTSEGEVVHEHYRGAVIPESLIRSRPSPPRGVSAIGDKFEAVRVSWAPSLEPEVKGFIVFRAQSLVGEYEVAARLEGRYKTELVDEGPSRYGLTGGTRYFYRVKAFNSSGALSRFSVTASDVVKGGPEPPTELAGDSGQVRKIRITWTPNSDEKVAGYRIFRSKTADGKYQLIYEIPNPLAAEYTDTPRPEDGHNFEEGINYWYKVLSYDSLGRTGELSEATEAKSMEKPAAPGGLRVESMTQNTVQLAWEPTENPEIAGYVLYRSASLEGLFEPVTQIKERWVSNYVDENSPSNRLRPDMVYYYKLTVLNHAGAESHFSPPAVASMAKPLQPPSHLQASTGLEGIIALSWS